MRVTKCYVATPVKKFWDRKDWNEHLKIDAIRQEAVRASRLVKQLGFLPISAPQLFIEVLSEDFERDLALSWGRDLLSSCECFAYFGSDLSESNGIKSELEIALEIGIRVVDLDVERGFLLPPRVERDSFGMISLIDSDGSDFSLGEVGELSEGRISRFIGRNSIFSMNAFLESKGLSLVSYDINLGIVDKEIISLRG